MAKREGSFELGEFYAREAQTFQPLPPDVITVKRYMKAMRELGVILQHSAAGERLLAKANKGELEQLPELVYDTESKKNVRAWKIVNAKAKPNKKARVPKKD